VKSEIDDRYCSNCRTELPRRATHCEQCGVYAGEVFDGRIGKRSIRPYVFLAVFILCLAMGWFAYTHPREVMSIVDTLTQSLRPGATKTARQKAKPHPEKVRVVRDRPGGARRAPGAKITEPEAILMLRRYVEAKGTAANDCIVVKLERFDGADYVLSVLDRCSGVRTGTFRVNGLTGDVSQSQH
jgi:hypothetical protein